MIHMNFNALKITRMHKVLMALNIYILTRGDINIYFGFARLLVVCAVYVFFTLSRQCCYFTKAFNKSTRL